MEWMARLLFLVTYKSSILHSLLRLGYIRSTMTGPSTSYLSPVRVQLTSVAEENPVASDEHDGLPGAEIAALDAGAEPEVQVAVGRDDVLPTVWYGNESSLSGIRAGASALESHWQNSHMNLEIFLLELDCLELEDFNYSLTTNSKDSERHGVW